MSERDQFDEIAKEAGRRFWLTRGRSYEEHLADVLREHFAARTCANCRHWNKKAEHIYGPGRGYCGEIECTYDDSSAETKADFSCSLFESRESRA